MAVVTGATGTLGRLVVADLAARGVAVLAVSRSGAAPGAGEAASVAADLSDASAVDAVRAALPAGDLVMAVHAVGLPGSPGVLDVDAALLGRAVDLKAGGFRRLIDAVTGRLVDGSRLVAVGGHLGAEPSEHAPLAGVANAALASVVRQLVRPIGRTGATVHLVAPGPFESERVEALVAAKASGEGVTPAEMRARMAAEYPGGRLPRAEDVAAVVTMLLGPGAVALHGATLFADGGIRRSLF